MEEKIDEFKIKERLPRRFSVAKPRGRVGRPPTEFTGQKKTDQGLTKPELFKKMKESGINLQVHYIPIHLQPFYQKNYGFNTGDYPVSEDFYTKEVSLPIYPDLSNDDQEMAIDSLFLHINA